MTRNKAMHWSSLLAVLVLLVQLLQQYAGQKSQQYDAETSALFARAAHFFNVMMDFKQVRLQLFFEKFIVSTGGASIPGDSDYNRQFVLDEKVPGGSR
jgi:hypothetical protein